MQSESSHISALALQFLKKHGILFVGIDAARFVSKSEPGNDSGLDYWVVSYEYKVFELEIAFIYIDDLTKNVMYILTKHGVKYDQRNQ